MPTLIVTQFNTSVEYVVLWSRLVSETITFHHHLENVRGPISKYLPPEDSQRNATVLCISQWRLPVQ